MAADAAAVLDRATGLTEVTQRVHWTDRLGHMVLIIIALALLVFLAGPLFSILAQSVESKDGNFVGFDNFIAYMQTPSLKQSLWNSLWVSTA